MRIPGERIKRTRLIQTDKYVVAIEVELVIPPDDPSEPCYESETVQLLREVGSMPNAAMSTGSVSGARSTRRSAWRKRLARTVRETVSLPQAGSDRYFPL